MTRLTDAMTQAAIRFVWLTGRVLDQRRLAYFTGDGDRDGVLGALAAYGTTDGAYAFGLDKNAVSAPWLDAATEFCWTALDGLTATHPYEVESALAFLDNAPDRARATAAAQRLGALVRDQGLVMLDPARPERFTTSPGYADSEFHYAYDFAPTPRSLAAQWFSATELAVALDHLADAQEADGGWQIGWRRWGPTTESEARPGITIERLHMLRAWDLAV